MTTNDILKLIDAGFTKAEIAKLDPSLQFVPEQQPEHAKQDPKEQSKAEPKQEPAPDPVQPTSSNVVLSDDQFTKLLQQLNVQGASLDVPPEQDMATKLGEHFKDLIVGK